MLSVGEALDPPGVGGACGSRRQLRELGKQVLELLLDLVRELVRVDARREDLLELVLQLLGCLSTLLLLLRCRRRRRRRGP